MVSYRQFPKFAILTCLHKVGTVGTDSTGQGTSQRAAAYMYTSSFLYSMFYKNNPPGNGLKRAFKILDGSTDFS